ncbi:MAG TPA: hypothetical protein VNA29_09655 [Sphingomicrobium sp.]|nr:hypothetical protein [Sphingomicrobium sp.]
MPRSLRLLLSAIAGFVAAWVALLGIVGAAAGVAWIFLFGDEPWPRWGEWLILGLGIIGAIAVGIVIGLAAGRAMARGWQ